MPTYDYHCDSCGHQFDVYQSMKDDKLTTCPNCGKETLRRLIGTGSGLIFKGSGFYLTDYKNKPSEKSTVSPAAASSESNKTETPATGKKDTAPAESKTSGKVESSKTKTTEKSGSKDSSVKS